LLVAVTVAAPARAQSHVYGNADLGKPIAAETRLAPEEAVRVLRGSHSITDLTDYRSPGRGPTIVVMGESTTPWDWPVNAFAPTRPLANDYDDSLYAPTGYGYVPYYASNYFGRQRRANPAHHAMGARPERKVAQLPPRPPVATPRHTVMSSEAGGRRR
jgi:hypothetical protein